MRESIYLSFPGSICAAGKDADSFYHAAAGGIREGIKPVTLSEGVFPEGGVSHEGQSSEGGQSSERGVFPEGGQSFLVGTIDDSLLAPTGDPFDMRILRIADAALEQIRPAVEAAIAEFGAGRVGVCAGSCDNGSECSLAAHRQWIGAGSFPAAYELSAQSAWYPAVFAARKFGVTGPALGISTACASSAGAIIKGAELIQAGICDAVIAGGADIASETVLLGFGALEALSETLCNPFSINRSGITLGEGAAFFVLSRIDLSGAGIRILGRGQSSDASHMTAPRADGSGAAKAMEEALKEMSEGSGYGPDDIGYINLHGTGTPLNDAMEAQALHRVFPQAASFPPVSSTKPITGHTLGAAGALELALCWMALHKASVQLPEEVKLPREAALPAHCWDGQADPELPPLRFAAPGDIPQNLRVCMSNSFAFGGCNTSLIIGAEQVPGGINSAGGVNRWRR